MLSAEERDRVLERLLSLARTDDAVVGAALTGSHAAGENDRWSDVDLVLSIRDDPAAVLDSWTARLYDEFGALHHWDLPAGSATIRVFLLPGWMEADITFAPEAGFGPRGPQWRTVFGRQQSLKPFAAPTLDGLAGHAWHHVLHARVCIERGRRWQAEHWISATRDQVITLACSRLGLPIAYAKGAHLLPDDVTSPLEATLIRSLTEPELRRALNAVIDALMNELEHSAPALAARLRPSLKDLRDV